MSCYVLLSMQSLVQGNYIDLRLKIKFNCHMINTFLMRMSFLEQLQILKEHWGLGKIGFLFLVLIFAKYF